MSVSDKIAEIRNESIRQADAELERVVRNHVGRWTIIGAVTGRAEREMHGFPFRPVLLALFLLLITLITLLAYYSIPQKTVTTRSVPTGALSKVMIYDDARLEELDRKTKALLQSLQDERENWTKAMTVVNNYPLPKNVRECIKVEGADVVTYTCEVKR